MKKLFVSVVVCFLALTAVAAYAQSNLADIEKMIREQEAKHATVRLTLLHFEIAEAVDSAIRAARQFQRLNEKVQKLSGDHQLLCAQLPAIPHLRALREMETSAARVVELIGKVTALVKAGGTPSEGMQKLMAGDLAQLMQTIVADGAKLHALFSDLETTCAKEG
ncbi:MAG: hypothetical protein A3J10_01505 [Candidatus Sungbacteria bacterium RIFCSPLOWO2_02_FULL_54_10]|uniref:DUF5667 domain-containing protein n=2 Tax=Candidatus Sungiibacteriota TaxID=1817917 RepID=A0A1G2L9B5_9BACT|nr:MAG: hypothetical protein A2679_03825 [Candidatus Sungbacteria bacterium RIFCSPHIGHO2_01_FULL_54_26]OHA02603.1 MAG: hypothetical protein A3C92_03085 [Candidatus Sungbacteria bacterium RIFCSPHIGHO2_02_FULL_53_17]OHA07402.1 MAG: hypothetical protein A3B34_03020 [Candidatus Sungbacteria bacterium RIFCSPLOWO2_01_FULL_54_21]OHA12471.1 MAG: hypothetical protein A3J10_01505 [Candidatus Sungbacteria bacterium RIFCSPLOWO2_02_FULL_54_10]